MATQDPSPRLLTNPRYQVSFDLRRPSQTVNDRGDAIDTTVVTTGIRGVIYPNKARTLQRTGNMEKQVASIDIVTKFRLSVGTANLMGTPQTDADVVVWDNATWTVVSVLPFTNYGRSGFLVATADMLEYTPQGEA